MMLMLLKSGQWFFCSTRWTVFEYLSRFFIVLLCSFILVFKALLVCSYNKWSRIINNQSCKLHLLFVQFFVFPYFENWWWRFIVLPFIKGISEKIARMLIEEKMWKSATNPLITPPPISKTEGQTKNWTNKRCNLQDWLFTMRLTYYGQTNKALKTRINEHNRTVKNLDKY